MIAPARALALTPEHGGAQSLDIIGLAGHQARLAQHGVPFDAHQPSMARSTRSTPAAA